MFSRDVGSTRHKRDIDDGRLPRRVVPRHYNVELAPDIYSTPDPPFTFAGTVEIYITCVLTANYVVVNVKDLDFTLVSIVADLRSPVGTPSPILLGVSSARGQQVFQQVRYFLSHIKFHTIQQCSDKRVELGAGQSPIYGHKAAVDVRTVRYSMNNEGTRTFHQGQLGNVYVTSKKTVDTLMTQQNEDQVRINFERSANFII